MTAPTRPSPSPDPAAHRQRGPLLATLALLAVATLTLRLMGRNWWCECGSWVPWNSAGQVPHNSQHFVDAYSFSHVIHGMLFYAALRLVAPRVSIGWRFVLATLIEVVWELAENSPAVIGRYRDAAGAFGYRGDSVANSVADMACAMLGFLLARRLPWPATLAFIVIAEVVCLFWIRDNLTLNVIMLVHPIEAVKHWQHAG